MNRQNNVTSVKSFINFNNPLERWRRMVNEIDGNYYISSEARIMRMTPNGIFKEVKSTVIDNHLIIMMNGQSDSKRQGVRVCRLMLNYFIGGYYRGRRIGFKNNNKLDCRLKNLYWYQGFINEVDYNYLKNLKPKTLHKEDVLIVSYLLKKDIKILFDLVQKLTPLLYAALNKKGMSYDVKQDLSSIVLKLSEDLKEGKYKPVSNLVRYKKQDFINYLINLVLRLSSDNYKYIFSSSEEFIDRCLHKNNI